MLVRHYAFLFPNEGDVAEYVLACSEEEINTLVGFTPSPTSKDALTLIIHMITVWKNEMDCQ